MLKFNTSGVSNYSKPPGQDNIHVVVLAYLNNADVNTVQKSKFISLHSH